MKRLLLLSAVLFALIYISSMAYAEDYLWLEAEDASAIGYTAAENSSASGGQIMLVNNMMTKPPEGYSLTFDIKLSDTSSYDIWSVTNDVTSRNFSVLEWSAGDLNGQNGTKQCDLYKHKMAYVDQQIGWTKIASGVKLNAGESKFVIGISNKASSGPKSYMSCVDCVVIVPAASEYIPDESMERPKNRPHRFAHIELEDPDNPTFIGSVESPAASGGKMLYAYDIPSPVGSDNETLYYSFMLDEDDEYDLWYLGAEMNVMHLSGTKWSVDGQEPDKISSEPHNGVIIMNSAGATSDLPLYWQKLGTEKLEAGSHVLNINYTYRGLPGAERRHVIWADCAIVVPKEWGFTPPGDPDAKDKYPGFEIARLDARYFAEKYLTGDYNNITDNIIFPDTNVLTPGGSAITGIGGKDYPISENGEVIRPYFDEGDKSFDLPVYAKKADSASAYFIPATVKALEKYAISDISVSGSLNDQITASVDIKLNTSAETDITGSAMIIAALFDKNDILIGSGVKETEVTRDMQTLETSVKNNDAVEGAYLKVYLLNNRTLANKLCETKIMK